MERNLGLEIAEIAGGLISVRKPAHNATSRRPRVKQRFTNYSRRMFYYCRCHSGRLDSLRLRLLTEHEGAISQLALNIVVTLSSVDT